MPAPLDHAENRGWIESILQWIPGFRGYLRKENRREADELQREWLADRLQRAKRGLDAFARALTDAGDLDALPAVERLRTKLDTQIARIRGAMQGYSGFFDLVEIDEDVINKVYAYDVALMEQVGKLADDIDGLAGRADDGAAVIVPLSDELDSIADAWDQRDDMLKGLE